ncbi:MAG: hypothetical protein AAF468_14000 [Pseudomonadota bacterium]
MCRLTTIFLSILLTACFITRLAMAQSPQNQVDTSPSSKASGWTAGAYAFSDQLGGFKIRKISGKGTRKNPIIIHQDMVSVAPTTLVIRATRAINPWALKGNHANGFVHIHLVTNNRTGAAWVAYKVELREDPERPSDYGDGLSFDQRSYESDAVRSNRFSDARLDFEPYDRIVFEQGFVNPAETVSMEFLVTDFTPTTIFYIVQQPRIPAS